LLILETRSTVDGHVIFSLFGLGVLLEQWRHLLDLFEIAFEHIKHRFGVFLPQKVLV